MIGLWKRKRPDVLKHWYALLAKYQCDIQAFYDSIQAELESQQVPGLKMEIVEFAEGGLLSAKRFYLRMSREMLVFDVCAAPFGTNFFFTCRFAELPIMLHLWEVFVLLFVGLIGLVMAVKMFGFLFGPLLLLAAFIAVCIACQNLSSMNLQDADASLLQVPVIGHFYGVFLRKETYYREDTRIMYVDIVDRIVKQKVEEFTAAQGVNQVLFTDAPSAPKSGVLNTLLATFGKNLP